MAGTQKTQKQTKIGCKKLYVTLTHQGRVRASFCVPTIIIAGATTLQQDRQIEYAAL
jgi:hypothetical protein